MNKKENEEWKEGEVFEELAESESYNEETIESGSESEVAYLKNLIEGAQTRLDAITNNGYVAEKTTYNALTTQETTDVEPVVQELLPEEENNVDGSGTYKYRHYYYTSYKQGIDVHNTYRSFVPNGSTLYYTEAIYNCRGYGNVIYRKNKGRAEARLYFKRYYQVRPLKSVGPTYVAVYHITFK